MAAVQQDYILRQIELLRRFVARVVGSGDGAGLDEALQQAMHLQEKLFAMPAAEFLRKPVDEQVASLLTRESKAAGQAKCLTYAALLRETARLYEFRGQEELAAGARQLALQVALHLALDDPTDPEAVGALVKDLLAGVQPVDLHPPVRELLDEYVRRAG